LHTYNRHVAEHLAVGGAYNREVTRLAPASTLTTACVSGGKLRGACCVGSLGQVITIFGGSPSVSTSSTVSRPAWPTRPVASPTTHVGDELIGSGMLIMARRRHRRAARP
jgi:hypothetical protein